MSFSRNKVFKDNVHGYISVPEEYVRDFIDTDLFQRLRHIEQTGMRILFPGARHDRFIHSLGVYHLGHKAFECFMNNVRISYPDTHFDIFEDKNKSTQFWAECKALFEIACLMHDCGHAPFSHTLEYIYDLEPEGSTILREKIMEYVGSEGFQAKYLGEGGPHEVMSALLVCTEYRDAVEHILQIVSNDFGAQLFSTPEALEFIVRMIIGYNYENDSLAHQMQNCMIGMLNSKSIDVDSLDYIIRDAQMSGINNMTIDIDRLLQSLTIVEVTEFTNVLLRDKSINAIVLQGRLEQIDNKNASFEGRFEGKNELDGENTCVKVNHGPIIIDANAKVEKECIVEGNEFLAREISVNGADHGEKVPKLLAPGIISVRGTLNGTSESELSLRGSSATIQPGTNVQGHIVAKTHVMTSASLNGTITGTFTGEMLGNQKSLSKRAKLLIKPGFHKSSLSVIQNVIIARNYEYQWVYSHHKVVYYANYLEIELLRQCVRFILKKNNMPLHATDQIQNILSWKTMISPVSSEPLCGPYDLCGFKFLRPTDADLQHLFNHCWIECNEKDEVHKYLLEYRTRQFRKSLWKSYAEMRNFLNGFTNNEIIKLQEMLIELSSNNEDDVAKNGYRLNRQYGYPNEEFCNKLHELGLDDVVWVSGDSKLKELNPLETFIHFKDVDMTYGSVSTPSSVQSITKLNLFYIYYQPVQGVHINTKDIQKFLKDSLLKWSSNKKISTAS